ncbi:Sec-independent protein translocase protein TatB [Falsochrobactrum sp. TDYN1]|uniref:Sec-independent protein translocase protein TatB n=1 Tax=Falsochrobactrum tianjinense TaxID=2706015 RepID=A0A949PN17_9HYPH|nr:Sec-independent protein translocase protein TatB [Falsochrobactrum sp. TDYN1]MBV2142886.1 Sec-independent protein translocase protein TatB [Falsochrobactrum sp. TDYN1]
MLDIGWSELLVVAIVLVVVVGPKDLPKMLRAFGKATARMRTTANEFRQQFNEALKEAELEDVKNIVDEARKLDPRSKLTQVFDPIRSAGEDLRSSLKSASSTSPTEPAKAAEVTTSVDASDTPVSTELPAGKPAATAKTPRKKAASKAAGEKPAAMKRQASKAAAIAKSAAVKPAAPARKTAKKTTEKTGSKA